MKKLIITSLCGLLLTGCFEEKSYFQQAVFTQLKNDQDIKDYALDPDEMTQCVVDIVAKRMPGFTSFDPKRQPIYAGYTKLIMLKSANKPLDVLTELREVFGSGVAVAKAQLNYSESVFACFQSLVSKTDPEA